MTNQMEYELLKILFGILLTIVSGFVAWIFKATIRLKESMNVSEQELLKTKTNYIERFGRVDTKLEEIKSLVLQESQTTRHTLRNDLIALQREIYQNFVNKDDCEKHH